MHFRPVVSASLLLAIGFVAGSLVRDLAAQAEPAAADEFAWEIQSAPYTGKEEYFYAIRYNRLTGEAWVLTVNEDADDDSWLLLPERDLRAGED